jgi:hypothetical protein
MRRTRARTLDVLIELVGSFGPDPDTAPVDHTRPDDLPEALRARVESLRLSWNSSGQIRRRLTFSLFLGICFSALPTRVSPVAAQLGVHSDEGVGRCAPSRLRR